jgi:AcrR family transcriptional regulator
VLQAADNLLVENGFAGVTIEGIAARAGVGKQTIYRWWSSKTDILLDAFLEDAAEQLIPPDLGDLGTDLRSHLRNCAEFLSKSDAGAVFRALVGEAQHDKQLASRLRSQYLREQGIRDRVPLQRAMERGEISPDVDVEMAIDQLMAPIHYRILVTGEPVTPDYTARLVHGVLTQLKWIKR